MIRSAENPGESSPTDRLQQRETKEPGAAFPYWCRVILYELLQTIETITAERYQQQLMQLNPALRLKRSKYASRQADFPAR